MRFKKIIDEISRIIIGKEEQITLALTCLFAGGHLLIEDLPGIGKTTLAKALAGCLGLKFRRVQFTSDMLPGDVLGVSVFEQENSRFVFHPGPVFTQVLLVDEINRATPKTQSALLEAMEERQVTAEGETRPLEPPFFVIATQNPLEQAGTFPLPESQLDRFLLRIALGYPDRKAERLILTGQGREQLLADLMPLMTPEAVMAAQAAVSRVHVSDAFLTYLQDILGFTRTAAHFHMGLSPRAGISLLTAARSWAYLSGRDYAIPEDLQHILPYVTGHRLRGREQMTEFAPDRLAELYREVPVP